MKKISIFSTLLAGVLALASCNQIEDTPVPAPEGFDQEDKVGTMAMTASLQDVANPIDLLTAEENINVMAFVANENVPVDARFEHTVLISPTENFVDSLTATVVGTNVADAENASRNVVSVRNKELNSAIKSVCGFEELTFTVYMQLNTVVIDAQGHRIILKSEALQTAPITTTPNVVEYYVVGDFSGWSQVNGQRLYSFNGAPATGWIVLNGQGANGWKISEKPDWSGINYGAGEEGSPEAEELLLSTDDGAGNITQYGEFCYQFEFDPAALKLKLLKTVYFWGVIGSFNGWGGDEIMELSTEEGMDYLYAVVNLTAGDEFKFRADAAWDTNFGDAGAGDGTLNPNGDNIKVAEDGTYEVRFYFCAEKPYYTLVKL